MTRRSLQGLTRRERTTFCALRPATSSAAQTCLVANVLFSLGTYTFGKLEWRSRRLASNDAVRRERRDHAHSLAGGRS